MILNSPLQKLFIYLQETAFRTAVPIRALQRRYDTNGRSQMQGGKNWILLKEKMQTGSAETLIGWKSGKTTYVSYVSG
jgi:hypothetical protein